jgi:hypothetical protein
MMKNVEFQGVIPEHFPEMFRNGGIAQNQSKAHMRLQVLPLA